MTVRQIYRISTMYWDDKYGTQSVSNEACCVFSSCSGVIWSLDFPFGFWRFFDYQVVAQMREILNKDNLNLTSNSFLLDDDLRLFSWPYLIIWESQIMSGMVMPTQMERFSLKTNCFVDGLAFSMFSAGTCSSFVYYQFSNKSYFHFVASTCTCIWFFPFLSINALNIEGILLNVEESLW